MAVLNPVVGPAADLLLLPIAQLVHRCAVGPQAVGSNCLDATVPLQRLLYECQRSFLISGLSDVTLEDLTFLVDRALQVVHLSANLHVHLVEVPVPVAKALNS